MIARRSESNRPGTDHDYVSGNSGITIAIGMPCAARLRQRQEDEAIRRRALETSGRAVEAALEAEVGAICRIRLNVAAIDAEARGTEETLFQGGIRGLDPAQLDIYRYTGLSELLTQPGQEASIIRAVLEVEKLDSHRPPSGVVAVAI